MANADNSPVTFWRASERFEGLVTGFHRFRLGLPSAVPFRDVFFPSFATIRFAIEDARPWSMRLGARRFDMPFASFAGPTDVAGWVEAQGGAVVGLGLRAQGWARLFGGDLSAYANRVVPLSTLDIGADALLDKLDGCEHPPAVFERWLDCLLAARRTVDPRLTRLEALIADAATARIETLAEELDLTARQLGTLSRRNFGFTPKVLLRRRRFLRALSVTLDAAPEESGGLLAEAGYWDRSHFLRDAHLFLGCSIREFRQRRGPLHALVMQTRAEVLGAPV